MRYLTKVDSRIVMSLKTWLKKPSKVLNRTSSMFLRSRMVFRWLLAESKHPVRVPSATDLSMPLRKGLDHLCYSLRPSIVQTKRSQKLFYFRLNNPFYCDLLLGKTESIIGE
jgi:hypothetical protein